MENTFRRVVTGHDSRGASIVQFDDTVDPLSQRRIGEVAEKTSDFSLVWSTDTFPANNADDRSGFDRDVGLTSPGGTVFRVVDFYPGKSSPMHRTNSLDYGIIMDGEVELELDNGTVVALQRGDVIVQRGTIHAWHNRTDKTCRMAFVFIDAR